MRVIRCLIVVVLALTSLPTVARESGDPWTAHYMWRRYHNPTAPCDAAQDKADYLCTGILMRATHPGEATHVWWPEAKSLDPNSASVGGVSFSYIRDDLELPGPFFHPNGFTLYPQLGKYKAPDDKMKLTVLCAFPRDGFTDARNIKGCGRYPDYPQVSQPCPAGMTGQQWVAKYPAVQGKAICGFDTTSQSRAAFKPFLDAMHGLGGRPLAGYTYTHNELRIAAWPANDATSKILPIESFFYVAGHPEGLTNARNDQLEFYNTTKQFVPIIKMTYPTAAVPVYDFSYTKSDQNPNVPIPKFPDQDPLPCDKHGGFDTKC